MKSLADLLKGRPGKRRYDPPADPPLDRSSGAAPPYALPDGLMRQVDGKSADELSSTFSMFRTGLSEHRTRLSEHRTDLSEHRTDLSGYRTELSQHRTDLSEHRTTLSYDRSHLSNERTHLSYVRTAVSLMSYGITLNRFAVFLAQGNLLGAVKRGSLPRMQSAEYMGLGMVLLGIVVLLWSLYRYDAIHRQITAGDFRAPAASVKVLSIAVIAFGALSAIILIAVK